MQTVNTTPNGVSLAEHFRSIVRPAACAIPTDLDTRRLRTVVAGHSVGVLRDAPTSWEECAQRNALPY